MSRRQPCMDGMPNHHWRSAGLDVPDTGRLAGTLVETFECPTCKATRTETYKGRNR